MKIDLALSQQDFKALLDWFSADRDEAGRQYEMIREGLIRFFRFRGCADPATLADETINRVASKISTLDSSKEVKTITYFYGFAANVFREYLRKTKNRETQFTPEITLPSQKYELLDSSVTEHDCLEDCLTKISGEERLLVTQYYSLEKSEKFEMRRKLAEKANLKLPALHTKVFRIRGVLRECIHDCLKINSL